jgi:two-component system response regulator FixJ
MPQTAHGGNAPANDVLGAWSENLSNNNMFGEQITPVALPERLLRLTGEVYVVEDDEALRRSIRRALHGAQLSARTYDRAADFLEEAPRLPGGCLVADLSMPGMGGLELIRRVQAARLPFSAVLITGQADVRLAVEAVKAGANDLIEKPFTNEALLDAVARALVTAAAPRGERPASVGWLAQLTARERQVLQGVVEGDTNKVIARRLRISPRTVEAYRASLMRKTGAATLADLVRRTLIAVAGVGGRSGGPPTTPGA